MITVYPKHISLKYWAATLLMDYNNEPLPILKDEKQWAKVVYNIINSTTN